MRKGARFMLRLSLVGSWKRMDPRTTVRFQLSENVDDYLECYLTASGKLAVKSGGSLTVEPGVSNLVYIDTARSEQIRDLGPSPSRPQTATHPILVDVYNGRWRKANEILVRAGFTTFEDVAVMDEETFLAMKNVGVATLRAVKQQIALLHLENNLGGGKPA